MDINSKMQVFTLKEIKDAGYFSLLSKNNSGFFSIFELKNAGYTLQEFELNHQNGTFSKSSFKVKLFIKILKINK